MRGYDEKPQRAAPRQRKPEGEDLIRPALAIEHGRRVLTPAAVAHLQRTAGNGAVSDLMDEERSPVLDVVGRGNGEPLDDTVRSHMEGAFAQDFSGVRVHTGSEASRSAASVQAHAYTVGNDIVFGDSHYSPGTDNGNRMLAHELTHVVQQRQGAVDGTAQANGISVSDPSDRFERAAEVSADRVMAGVDSAESGSAVQRQTDEEVLGDE